MKIESQVTSLEVSQSLVGVGFKRESYFCHAWMRTRVKRGQSFVWDKSPLIRMSKNARSESCFVAPAWTVAELGEALPDDAIIHHAFVALGLSSRLGKSHTVGLLRSPDMVAEILIWILENGHITKEQANEKV